MNSTTEQIQNAINSLPIEFADAIADSYISNKALEIGSRHSLHLDKVGKLQENAMLAALGLIESNKFTEVLIRDLNISAEKANLIVRDINQEIFEPIRQKVRERMEEEKEVPENEEVSPKAAPTENMDREALLKEIEAPAAAAPVSAPPTPVVSVAPPTPPYKVFAGPPENLPSGEPSFIPPPEPTMPPGLVGEKLSVAALTERKEIVDHTPSIASLKKTDPYREPVA